MVFTRVMAAATVAQEGDVEATLSHYMVINIKVHY